MARRLFMRRTAVAAVIGIAMSLFLVMNASAAQEEVVIDCRDDGTYTALVGGNGVFTPGKLVGGGVLIPVAFENQHSVFTDNEGNVFEDSEPDVKKGNGNPGRNKDLIVCDFTVEFEEEGGSGTFSGTVTGYIVGR